MQSAADHNQPPPPPRRKAWSCASTFMTLRCAASRPLQTETTLLDVQVVESLVDVYDTALPCFPPTLNPVVAIAAAHAASAGHLLDALGHAAPAYDNAALLTLLAWPSAFRETLRGLGLSDEHAAIPATPRVATPHGETVRMHGLDVARLVYIDRIRRQLAKAFKNVAEDDLLREPEPDGRGRLWTPGVIELFRFLTQQIQLAASVRDTEVACNVASVALQVMQR
jgi:hypothetical protein